MRKIFRQLKFSQEKKFRDSIQKSSFEFYVPGVNSGIYNPPSLHVSIFISEQKARFFQLKESKAHADITLTIPQFDELFEEMRKIKELRSITE